MKGKRRRKSCERKEASVRAAAVEQNGRQPIDGRDKTERNKKMDA